MKSLNRALAESLFDYKSAYSAAAFALLMIGYFSILFG